MAIEWRLQQTGRNYEVRSAGQSLRLFTDGLFHSQYNRRQVLSGSVWDLLSIPTLWREPGSVKRVLLLGVGGGAVIQQLRVLCRPEVVVGVELDPVHIRVMKKHFGIKGRDVEIHCADAKAFVEQYQGEKFDLVIDDVFGGDAGEPQRAIAASRSWFKALNRLLAKDGMLVMNFADKKSFLASALLQDIQKGIKSQPAFQQVYALKVPSCYNHIAVFSKIRLQRGLLRKRLLNLKQQKKIGRVPTFSCSQYL